MLQVLQNESIACDVIVTTKDMNLSGVVSGYVSGYFVGKVVIRGNY